MALLVAITALYLGFLFFVAWIGTRRARSGRGGANAISLSLALGVLVTSASYYGDTLSFVGWHVGSVLGCMLGPVVWKRVLHVCRTERLDSLADLFALRFRSQFAGALTTVVAVVASVPYVAQQLRALAESAVMVTGEGDPYFLALVSSVVLAAFTMLFGGPPVQRGPGGAARAAEQTAGVVLAIACESLVKLVALAAVGAVALFAVFDGPADLGAWLDAHPGSTLPGVVSAGGGSWATYTFLGFAVVFLLPRQFYVAFASAPSDRVFARAMVGLPVYLLFLHVAAVLVTWGARRVVPDAPVDFAALAVPEALGLRGVTWLSYLGGVSASSAMVIVTTVALGRMVVVHLVLPANEHLLARDLYRRLAWLHRTIAVLLVLAGYLFFLLLETRTPLIHASTVSIIAFAQFLPGTLAALFFRSVTRVGFVSGLMIGIAIWALTALAPLLGWVDSISWQTLALSPLESSSDPWTFAAFMSVGANAAVLVAVSSVTRPSEEEREAATRFGEPQNVGEHTTTLANWPRTSAETLEARLASRLGRDAAETEVRRTMRELSLDEMPFRATALEPVRRRLEANLTELLGPVLASRLVEVAFGGPITRSPLSLAEQLRSIDEALETLDSSLSGPAAELDVYRRFLSAVLDGMSLGVCAIGPDRRVVLWNPSLATITGVASQDIVGGGLDTVPASLRGALESALDGAVSHDGELTLRERGKERTLLVHASRLDPETGRAWSGAAVAVVEDITERRGLEAVIAHRDRLASIGRVAAGVAHEIGNPLSAIMLQTSSVRREAPSFHERLSMVLEDARRIDAIIRELLDYSRSDRPATVLPDVQEVPMRALVEEAFRLVGLDRAGAGVELRNEIPEDVVVEGDSRRLTQVIVNLVTNAIDAAGPGGGHVVIGATSEGDRVIVTVSDDGPGLPARVLKHLFEPFVSTKGPGKGTGLGLWLVHNIVRQHRGEVSIASESGRGTTVTLRLPRTQPRQREQESLQAQSQ